MVKYRVRLERKRIMRVRDVFVQAHWRSKPIPITEDRLTAEQVTIFDLLHELNEMIG